MGAPVWWKQRRFGLHVQANLACVPAWAPIGEYASWYRAGLDPTARDVLLHASPLIETVQHHQARWDHVERHEDFLPFLTFDEFDPDEWAALARDAGMGYLVATAKHHDGLCWWDAPATDLSVTGAGPRRDVLLELSAACERAELVFGTSYSLLDWADERYPTDAYVDEVLHPHVLDLVERYGSRLLWGDGHWGAGPDHWRSDALVKLVREIDPEIVINDRWWADGDTVRTYEYRVPTDISAADFEVRRGLGTGFGFNRVERDDHLLTPAAIVALLTEVVAKGGHLLLGVGVDQTGRVPDAHQERLRAAGGWVRRHADLLERSEPWTTWGDDDCRYLRLDGDVHTVDVTGRGTFRALRRSDQVVRSITTMDGNPVPFRQHDGGVELERPPRKAARLPTVYRIEHDDRPDAPIELFARERAPDPIELAPLLADASPGTIVQLGDGRYVGPARIPDRVTVRGLGRERTQIDGLESMAVTLGSGARLEHCTITGGGDRIVWLPKPVVALVGSDAAIIGCDVDGHVEITGDRARVRSCRGTGVIATDADEVEVSRSTFTGMQWDCAVDITGGSGHVVEGCECRSVLQAVRLTGTVGAEVRGNRLGARWWGVQLTDTEATLVFGNSFASTMRAVDIDGGTQASVIGNAVSDGDSGCVVQNGASDVEVTGNHWERCRVGLFCWNAGIVHHHANTAIDLLQPDHAVLVGP